MGLLLPPHNTDMHLLLPPHNTDMGLLLLPHNTDMRLLLLARKMPSSFLRLSPNTELLIPNNMGLILPHNTAMELPLPHNMEVRLLLLHLLILLTTQDRLIFRVFRPVPKHRKLVQRLINIWMEARERSANPMRKRTSQTTQDLLPTSSNVLKKGERDPTSSLILSSSQWTSVGLEMNTTRVALVD